MKEEIIKIICDCLRQLNQDINSPVLESPTAETRLFGTKSALDSIALVNLLADLEEIVSQRFGKDFALADERAMSLTHSPFRRVDTLAEYILERIEDKQA